MERLILVVIVAFGGALGATFRFIISAQLNKLFHSPFPVATFSVNMFGCFLFGVLIYLKSYTPLNMLVLIGFVGSFTTFSTFSDEMVTLLQNGNGKFAVIYLLLSNVGGFSMVWFGKELISKLKL